MKRTTCFHVVILWHHQIFSGSIFYFLKTLWMKFHLSSTTYKDNVCKPIHVVTNFLNKLFFQIFYLHLNNVLLNYVAANLAIMSSVIHMSFYCPICRRPPPLPRWIGQTMCPKLPGCGFQLLHREGTTGCWWDTLLPRFFGYVCEWRMQGNHDYYLNMPIHFEWGMQSNHGYMDR